MRRNGKKTAAAAAAADAFSCTYESFDSLFDDDDVAVAAAVVPAAVEDFAEDDRRRPFGTMFRSRSDGNLTTGFSRAGGRSGETAATAEPRGFAKYLRALSGSWKNLLNSKHVKKKKIAALKVTRYSCINNNIIVLSAVKIRSKSNFSRVFF